MRGALGVAFAARDGKQRCATGAKQVGKCRNDGDDGKGKANPGERSGRNLWQMPNIHAIHNAVKHIDKLGKNHWDSELQNIF